MPDSGGSAPCHQGHMRTFSTVEDTHDLGHDSGTWMEVPAGGGGARNLDAAPFDTRLLRNQIRGHGQFVTVVAVEKDDGEEGEDDDDDGGDGDRGGTCSVMGSSTLTCQGRPTATQPVPKAAPRGFVTVVAVGADSSLHLNHTVGTLTANLRLHLGPSDQEDDDEDNTGESDYVNQEMIDRERRSSSFTAAGGEGDRTAEDSSSSSSAAPSTVPDQVVVYRLPGERLGLGLKFDGGMGSRECVKRLFIQSVAPDSPAARAAVPWGELHPGDQILNIEGCAVSSMTRVQCVSFLKDAAMKITIGVLKGNGILPDFENNALENQDYYRRGQEQDEECDSSRPPPLIVGEMRKRVPPPPLPPRSRPRKSPARPPKDALPVPPPPSAFQDMDEDGPSMRYPHQSSSSLDDGDDREHSLQRWREMVFARRNRPGDLQELIEDLEFHHPVSWITRRMEDSIDGDLPPIPAFYHDLVGEEDAMGPCESESDETNSSVSTVVDRLSLSSSTTVSRNSSFNATADTSRFDLARALSPFEQLEKELETENMTEVSLSSSTPHTAPRDDASVAPPIDRTTKPPSAEAPDAEAEVSTSTSGRKASTGKMKMRPSIKSFSFSLKGRPFSWQQGKTHERGPSRTVGRAENFLSIKRHSKRPAPPPPPRSIEMSTSQTNTVVTVTSNMAAAESHSVHDDSDDYIDMVAEAAKQGITTPVNLGSRKKNVGEAISLKTTDEPKLSPEYLMILNSPAGDEAPSEFPSKGFYADIEEEIKKVKRSSADASREESSNSGDESEDDPQEVQIVVKERENDYVELVPTSEVESHVKEEKKPEKIDPQSMPNENDLQGSDKALPSANTVEIEAQVHQEASDTDNVSEVTKPQEGQSKGDVEEGKGFIPTEPLENIYEGEYLGESDDNEEESDDANGSDDEDEGSYILDPDLYDDSEGFLSCSSPKISPPILSSRRSLRLPSLIISEANEMGVYEDLYDAYSSIDDRSLDLCLERPLVLGDRGLPSVPEEDSGDQDDTIEEEDPYILYDDVEGEATKASEGNENEGNESQNCEAAEKESETSENDPSAQSDSAPETVDSEKVINRTISQAYKAKRLRHDLGELIRREMNLEGDVTVEVEEEEEIENLVECANEEELLLVMRALRQDQPGDKLSS
ncbi:uncharacterized protein LOC135225177 [Macrobrachium nipponense]|uniref:uncharacterized protein LOC135225177 n=1 Tax=Macrobrachium nipponense TaxID=159736 RepID=UPI0030C8CD11